MQQIEGCSRGALLSMPALLDTTLSSALLHLQRVPNNRAESTCVVWHNTDMCIFTTSTHQKRMTDGAQQVPMQHWHAASQQHDTLRGLSKLVHDQS